MSQKLDWMEPGIRILIVGHSLRTCDVIAVELEDEPDIRIVGVAISVNDALRLAPESDVILVNTQMPDDGAFKLIRAIAAEGIPSKALVTGLAKSKNHILRYIQAGAAGYVLKNESVDDLLGRVWDITAGRVRISPQIASWLMSRLSEYGRVLQQVKTSRLETDALTAREAEVLDLIGKGFTNPEIASLLMIELGTVKNHVHNILQKMNASTRQEAATRWVIVREGAGLHSDTLDKLLSEYVL